MDAYSTLAGFYDRLMDDVDYSAWADYYFALLERAGIRPKRLCDCACGTGSMSIQFALRGVQVTGVDISEEMLRAAQDRARSAGIQAMFVRQDICALRLPRPVDALVCACDGVNYLLNDARLAAFFHSAHAALRPGGALAFDISSAWKLKNTLGNGLYGEDREDLAYLWFNRFDENARTVTMNLSFFVREEDGRYRRLEETHVQKAHEASHIAATLAQSGFSSVEFFGNQTFDPPKEADERIHFLAVRE